MSKAPEISAGNLYIKLDPDLNYGFSIILIHFSKNRILFTAYHFFTLQSFASIYRLNFTIFTIIDKVLR